MTARKINSRMNRYQAVQAQYCGYHPVSGWVVLLVLVAVLLASGWLN
jgi:hypothetical protein